MRKTLASAATAALVVGGGLAAAATPVAAAATPAPHALVRVDQVGYASRAPKSAFVMLSARTSVVRFEVRTKRRTVLHGTARRDFGSWNANYGAVYRLDFSRLRRTGSYQVVVESPVRSASPWFRVESASALYTRLIRNGVRYFTSERDGADVDPSVLDRKPANLTDSRATIYKAPKYDSDDTLVGGLSAIGGPVDVAGGWFDAGGGYEKFGYTASYADALMSFAALRDPHATRMRAEARFGLQWLEKLWNPRTRTAYIQVGIGAGGGNIAGDYDYWFLPQQEDRLGAKKGDPDYYVEYRPVFEAAAPGHLIDPDIAGRYAAAFALGARLDARSEPRTARHLLSLARSIFAQAHTKDVHSIVTAYPYDFYPGTQWRSDMLWGATEIRLADSALRVSRARAHRDLAVAVRWGRSYLAQSRAQIRAGTRDTLNLYDDGAVAEADLIQAEQLAGGRPALPVRDLLGDLAAQLQVGRSAAQADPFRLGFPVGTGDATPHAFGLYTTDQLYRQYGGSGRYASFAQHQLDYALGANPWGSSFVVGAGHTFPNCMQSEIANLSGSLDGRGRIQLGAVGDGPSAPSNFEGLGTVDGMRTCSAGDYTPFDNARAAYEDNVVAWPSVEPADDYTMNSVLAFTLAAYPTAAN